MRADRRTARLAVVAALALGVLALQATFEPPAPRLERRPSFAEDLSPRTVRIEFSGAPRSVTEADGAAVRRVEVGPVSTVTISTSDGGAQQVSAALFFEVLAIGQVGIADAALTDGSTTLRAGSRWTSAQLQYRCCGEDSAVVAEVDASFPLEQVGSMGAATALEFSLEPAACEYDPPKVLCRFVRITGGTNDVLVEGGHLLVADLVGADVSGSQLLAVDLRGTSFAGANLSRALVREANLMEVDLAGAEVRQTIFRKITSDRMLGRP